MAQATNFISWLRSFVEKDDPKPTTATFNTGSFVPVGQWQTTYYTAPTKPSWICNTGSGTPVKFDKCTDMGKGLYIHAEECHCKRGFIDAYRKMIHNNRI